VLLKIGIGARVRANAILQNGVAWPATPHSSFWLGLIVLDPPAQNAATEP